MIAVDIASTRFQYRVAGVALHLDRVLVASPAEGGPWFLPGGRVEIGEAGAEALRREMREELEAEAVVGRLLWFVENFFRLGATDCHELCAFFEMDLPDALRSPGWTRADPRDRITLGWRRLADLDAGRIQPAFLRRALHELPAAPRHVVVRDGWQPRQAGSG